MCWPQTAWYCDELLVVVVVVVVAVRTCIFTLELIKFLNKPYYGFK